MRKMKMPPECRKNKADRQRIISGEIGIGYDTLKDGAYEKLHREGLDYRGSRLERGSTRRE
jgi:hypothetical protein